MGQRVEDKKAVVSGSGGAMGGAIALRLAEEGADIVLNDRLPDLTNETETAIRDLGRDVVSVVANVTRREGAEQAHRIPEPEQVGQYPPPVTRPRPAQAGQSCAPNRMLI